MEILELVVAAIVTAILVTIYVRAESRKYPPGPYGFPVIGYLPFMGKHLHVTFANLRKKYGNVVSVNMGPKTVVILNDWEAIREALVAHGDTFSGRAMNSQLSTLTQRNGLVATDGLIWHQHKRFAIRLLRDLGFGRASMERDIINEVEILAEYLKSKDGTSVDMRSLFFLPVLNLICKITCGKRYNKNDDELQPLIEAFNILHVLTMTRMKFFSFVRALIPRKISTDNIARIDELMGSVVKKETNSHWNNLNENNLQDFTDMYLAEIRRRKEANGSESAPFTRSHLMGSIIDLLLAGVETSESTLAWALLFVTHNSEIQSKIQRELDGLMTTDSILSFNSKGLTPYTEATLMEVQRCASVVPLALSHRTIRDTVLLGHNIPKDTIVFPNLYAVHHDERHWGDPNMFRPERFLDDNGQVKTDDHLMPFSAGSRLCLGESMAKMVLFLFFTSLLRRFTFSFVPGEPIPTLELGRVAAVIRPQPHSMFVSCRD